MYDAFQIPELYCGLSLHTWPNWVRDLIIHFSLLVTENRIVIEMHDGADRFGLPSDWIIQNNGNVWFESNSSFQNNYQRVC